MHGTYGGYTAISNNNNDSDSNVAVQSRGVKKKSAHRRAKYAAPYPPTQSVFFKAPINNQQLSIKLTLQCTVHRSMHSAPQHAMLIISRQLAVCLLCKLFVLLCMLCLLPQGGGKGWGRLPGAEEKKGNTGRNKGQN